VRGQRHAPAAPYPRERHVTHCTGGWVSLRAGLDWCGKFLPTGIRSPDLPAHRQSLYRLRYPVHIFFYLPDSNFPSCIHVIRFGIKKFAIPCSDPVVTSSTYKCDGCEEMGVKKFVWMQINLKRLAHFAAASCLLFPFEFFPCNCHRSCSREEGL